MKRGVGDLGAAADHVEVDAGAQVAGEVGVADSQACEPVISGSQRKRIVRRGGGRVLSVTAARSARATPSSAALPEALSLAPADSWQRCAVRTISPAAGSVPGMVAETTSKVAGTIFARTWACRTDAAR